MADNSQAVQAADADTLNRKLNELRMAVDAEHQQSKQDILAGYLNDAYFGNNAYGIETAAETYFGTSAAKLSVTQAATLAGIVENPTAYDPILHPATALERRNTVLARMAQTNNGLTTAQATADEAKPLGLNVSEPQSGCQSSSVGSAGFFCQYVEEVFLHDPAYGKTPMDRAKLLSTGGLKIYTTLDPQDQQAANSAVNYVEPGNDGYYNPGRNADTEAVVQPGTGSHPGHRREQAVRDRPRPDRDRLRGEHRLRRQFRGPDRLLLQAVHAHHRAQAGHTLRLHHARARQHHRHRLHQLPGWPGRHYNGIPGAYNVTNAEGPGASTDSLYTGTTNSINVFYAELEKKVGLCNVVHTAVDLGMTRADGTSLLSPDGSQDSADNIPSFTLGSVNVSPLSMAAAYATVAARGTYCSPVAIGKIVTSTGGSLAVPSANCHQALSSDVADAVNYILQGVLTSGTAANIGGLAGREAAGKTGTSNVANNNGTPYAAFAGYTPNLVGYVSVFNPVSPTFDTMGGQSSCYRLEVGGLSCPGEMFGADAPGSTWHMTFDHADLGPVTYFVPVPADSPFNSLGNGQVVVQPKQPKSGNGGGNGGNGGGNGGNGGGGGTAAAEAAADGGNGGGGGGGGTAAERRRQAGKRRLNGAGPAEVTGRARTWSTGGSAEATCPRVT